MLKLGAESGRTIRTRSRFSIPRADIRHKVSVEGKLILSPSAPIILNCLIVDLSFSGAKVEIKDQYQLPKQVLLFESYKQNIYECRVQWQDKHIADLYFIDLYSQSSRRVLMRNLPLGRID
jgi:hypothetical protein